MPTALHLVTDTSGTKYRTRAPNADAAQEYIRKKYRVEIKSVERLPGTIKHPMPLRFNRKIDRKGV